MMEKRRKRRSLPSRRKVRMAQTKRNGHAELGNQSPWATHLQGEPVRRPVQKRLPMVADQGRCDFCGTKQVAERAKVRFRSGVVRHANQFGPTFGVNQFVGRAVACV